MLLITVPLITAVYFLPTLAGLAAAGTEDIEWTAGAFTVDRRGRRRPLARDLPGGGRPGRRAGLFSSLLLTISRVPFVMGEDGLPAQGAAQAAPPLRDAMGGS